VTLMAMLVFCCCAKGFFNPSYRKLTEESGGKVIGPCINCKGKQCIADLRCLLKSETNR
jgi:hypothetical protein